MESRSAARVPKPLPHMSAKAINTWSSGWLLPAADRGVRNQVLDWREVPFQYDTWDGSGEIRRMRDRFRSGRRGRDEAVVRSGCEGGAARSRARGQAGRVPFALHALSDAVSRASRREAGAVLSRRYSEHDPLRGF